MSNTHNIGEIMRLNNIAKICKQLSNVSYPQMFCEHLHRDTNCMAYAIGATVPDFTSDAYFPGGLRGKPHILNKDSLVSDFILDMKELGIAVEIIDKDEASRKTYKNSGKQVVSMYFSEKEDDFHFIRKDQEGGWSHKQGYLCPPKKFREYRLEDIVLSSYELIAFFSLSFE